MTRSLNHKIWEIAWPAILSNISLPLLGLVDTAILGHLDDTRYLGAVAIGSSLLAFVYWGFGFLRMGTTGLVARAHGAKDPDRELAILLQSMVLAVLLAVAVIALHPWWLDLGLYLMAPGQEIASLARSYAGIRIYSAPALLVTYAITGWFIGRANTRWPMLFVVFTNALNILLDILFIVVLDMKSDGAALATLCAEYSGCAVALAALWRNLVVRPTRAGLRELLVPQHYATLLATNQFLFVRTMCLLFSFAFFTAMSTRLGQNVLAANTIMLNLLVFSAYALDGFAYAAEALSGQALGARNLPLFFRTCRACAKWSLLTAAVLSTVLLAAHPLIFPLFGDHQQVQALLTQHRGWLIAMPLIAAASYLLDGIFIGAALSRYMMQSMLVSLLLVYLPAWYLLIPLGNTGLWIAFTLFTAARGVTLGWHFRSLTLQRRWLGAH